MEAKRSWFDQHCDALRKLIIAEPRGHHGMFAAVLTDPVSEQAQAGVFFLETESTLRMCVHGSMGVAAVLFRMGYRGSELLLDSPAGLIRARALDPSMNEISITNVPSFLVDEVQLTLEGRAIRAQIAWGGNLFALVSSTDLGISLHQENIHARVRHSPSVSLSDRCRLQGKYRRLWDRIVQAYGQCVLYEVQGALEVVWIGLLPHFQGWVRSFLPSSLDQIRPTVIQRAHRPLCARPLGADPSGVQRVQHAAIA